MMHKEHDVTALGELLIDFTENGVSSFESNAGKEEIESLSLS